MVNIKPYGQYLILSRAIERNQSQSYNGYKIRFKIYKKAIHLLSRFFLCSSILNVIKLGINVTDMEGICL